MPLFCFGRVEADTVIGSKPKITFVIFDDGIYLIVDERLLVANRMFDPFITGILIVAYCDADRVISHPDAFIIYIEVVNTVAVHGIIAIVIRHDVGGALIGIHIHFIYTGTICSYQYFFVIEGFDTCNADILQTDIQLYSLMNIHIIQINAFLERTDE